MVIMYNAKVVMNIMKYNLLLVGLFIVPFATVNLKQNQHSLNVHHAHTLALTNRKLDEVVKLTTGQQYLFLC